MELVELIKTLIKFQSYTGNIDAINSCLNFCIRYFKNLNRQNIFIKEVCYQNTRSVLISNVDTLNLDVLEVGHIDVVPVNDFKMFEPIIKDNVMYGRGTGDMKGFVASAIKLFEYVVDNNFNLKYGLLIVSDEEPGGFYGSKYWAENMKLKAKIVLDADAGNSLNKIIYKAKASYFIKLISKGKSAHGSKPWLGSDAIENLILTINNLRKTFLSYSTENIPNDEWITTLHIGKIKGGEADNSIAENAEAILDFRTTEKYSTQLLLKIIQKSLVGNVKIEIQEEGIFVNNNTDNKYLQLYKDTIEEQIKEKVIFDFATGASDARYFTGKDTVIISNQANCGNLHSDNEWLDLSSLNKFYEIRKRFIEKLQI